MPDQTGDNTSAPGFYVIEQRSYDGAAAETWWYRNQASQPGAPYFPQYFGAQSYTDALAQILLDRTNRGMAAASVTVFTAALTTMQTVTV